MNDYIAMLGAAFALLLLIVLMSVVIRWAARR